MLEKNASSQASTTDLDRLQKLKSDIVSGLHPIYCVPDEEEPPPLKKEKSSSAVSPTAPPAVAPAPLDYERPTNDKRSASASAAPASPADPPISKKRRKRERKAAKLVAENAATLLAEPAPALLEPEVTSQPVSSLSIPALASAELSPPSLEPVDSVIHPSQPGMSRISGSLAFDLAESGDEAMRDLSAAPSPSVTAAPDLSALAHVAAAPAPSDSLQEQGRLSAARMTQSLSAEGVSATNPQEGDTYGIGLTRDGPEDQPMQELDGAPIDLDTEMVEKERQLVAGPSETTTGKGANSDGHDVPVTSTDAQRELENLAGNARKRGGKKNRQKAAARNGRQSSPGRQRTSTEGSAGFMPSRGSGGPREAFRPTEPVPPMRDPYLDHMGAPPGRFYDDRGLPYDHFYDRGPPPMLPPPTGRWDDQRARFPGGTAPFYDRSMSYYGPGYPAPFPDQGYRPDLVFDRPRLPDLYQSGFYLGPPPQAAPYNGPATPMAGSYRDSGRRNRY